MGNSGNTVRETSGITTCLVYRYVRDQGGDEGLRALLARAGIDHGRLEADRRSINDEKAWFTYEEKIALFEAAAEVLDDKHVTLHMGERALDYQVGAAFRALLSVLGSPRVAVRQLGRSGAKLTTVATTTTLEVKRHRAVVAYELQETKQPHVLDCEYNIGLFRSFGPFFGRPPAIVQHNECQLLGAPRCVYVIRWSKRPLLPWRRSRQRTHELEHHIEALSLQLALLQSTTADLVSTNDTEELLERIVQRAAAAVGAPKYLLAVRLGGDELTVLADGLPPSDARDIARELMAAPESSSTPHRIVQRVATSRTDYGVLAAFFDDHTFFEHERTLLASYARSAAAAIEKALLLDRVTHRAMFDELTALPNRRYFEEQAEAALARSRRNDSPVAILFVDLDRFKEANDQYGHLVGDEVLRVVAQRIRDRVRAGDLAARVGGDELTVLLPDADRETATTIASRLRAAIELPIPVGQVTVSISGCIGVATTEEFGTDFRELLQAADTAMYDAKKHGRNVCAVRLRVGTSELVRESA